MPAREIVFEVVKWVVVITVIALAFVGVVFLFFPP
jgi:hypothetical protein